MVLHLRNQQLFVLLQTDFFLTETDQPRACRQFMGMRKKQPVNTEVKGAAAPGRP